MLVKRDGQGAADVTPFVNGVAQQTVRPPPLPPPEASTCRCLTGLHPVTSWTRSAASHKLDPVYSRSHAGPGLPPVTN